MALSPTTWVLSGFALSARVAISVYSILRAQSALLVGFLLWQRHASRRNDVYTILWAVVFGFATLNILSLAARRFEPNRRGLTFGELMAVLVVLLSIFLLGWELLGLFRIFPIRLHR
jgi:glucan phosphoethanolaminetransferase (alkaline phosphatase superfamily)